MKYDYLIVGAGLYGATFARLAAERGKTCLIIDKRAHVGGNCYDYVQHGIHVHKYGAHIFHTSNKAVWEFVNRFSEFTQFQNNVKARSYGKLYSLPFNMNTFNQLFNVTLPAEAKRIIEHEIEESKIKKPTNLEEQAISLVGRTVYETLVKCYTEKQWGKSCKELSTEIIKRLPVRFTYDNNYFNDTYQGLPADGYTVLISRMIEHENIDIILNKDFFDGTKWNKMSKKVVYTGTIDQYFKFMYGELEWRTLNFVTKIHNFENHQGCPVMNICDHSQPFTRVIEHKHFLKDISKKTIVTEEYPKKYEKGDEQYYPIQDDKNKKLYDKYKALANVKCPEVIFGGRLGTYQYLDMHKVIEQAMNDIKKEFNE